MKGAKEMRILVVLLAVFAIITNLYIGFHGEIDPFNILAGAFLLGYWIYILANE